MIKVCHTIRNIQAVPKRVVLTECSWSPKIPPNLRQHDFLFAFYVILFKNNKSYLFLPNYSNSIFFVLWYFWTEYMYVNNWFETFCHFNILLSKPDEIIVYHLPTCNSIAGLGSLILILILSHIFEASTVEVSVNGSNICEWIKYLWMDQNFSLTLLCLQTRQSLFWT